MLRFAASPDGDMNINDLRIALFNYTLAKQKNESFIVRIEGTENQEVLDLLALFNIEYSQVVYQSQNFRFHSAMALDLLHKKKAFSCFCSDEWLEKKREEAKSENREYLYDDACRNLPAELVIDNTAPFTVRIARPDRAIIIHDKIKGELNFEPDTIDSFVIMNQDKTPTHTFASAVDDMLSDISMIVRLDKHMNDTAKQIHIRNSLGYEKEIEYAHLPPILDGDTVSVKSLLEQGYLPEAISNYLLSTGGALQKDVFTLSTLLDSSARFDIDMLKEINRKYLKTMDATELSRYVGFADADIGELARIYLTEVATTQELKTKIAPIFEPRDISEELAESVALLKNAIQKAPYYETYNEFKNQMLEETGIEENSFSKPLRILLTNAEDGPEIAEIYKYLKNYIGEIIKK
jgi:glutamyl-tRNA synthetase